MSESKILLSQRIIQICLFLVAGICFFGGALQMYLGEPETTPRLDNVHRFLAGVYFSMGPIAVWTAMTIRKQDTLIYLIAFGVLMAGVGRLISMKIVGLPGPVFLGYLIPELAIPVIMAIAQTVARRKKG